MAINQLIAQGIRPIGADLPQIGGLLMQKRQAEAQEQRQNELLKLQQGGLDLDRQRVEAQIAERERAAQAQQQEAGRQWLTNAITTVRQNPAQIPVLVREGKQRGILTPETPDTLTPEQVEEFALANGIAPREQVVPFEQTADYQKLAAQNEFAVRLERIRAEEARRLEALRQRGSGGPAAPAGYRFKPDGSLEPIPGGPADIKSGTEAEKARQRASNAVVAGELVLSAIGDAKNLVGRGRAGFGSQSLADRGYEPAVDLRASLETVKANLGFNQLQQMREASPTGGALGQVAVQELVALQSTVANLDARQSPEQLARNLAKVETHYNNWLEVMRQASGQNSYLDQSAPTMPSDVDAILKKYGGR